MNMTDMVHQPLQEVEDNDEKKAEDDDMAEGA